MAISQTITAIPAAGHRGVDSQTIFVTKQEAFQDALQGVTVTELNTFATQANALETNVNAKELSATNAAATATTKAGEASASAAAALASENAAAISAASAAALAGAFVGTSATSLLIEVASKSFITQTGEQYTTGIYMIATSQANPANYMFGQVTSYNSGTGALVINVTAIGGSGTYADWNLSLAGIPGATGPAGPTFTGGTITSPINITMLDKGTVSTGTVTFNQSDAEFQRLQVGGAITIAIGTWATTGLFGNVLIKLVNGGSATVTIPSTINWVKPDGSKETVFATYLTNLGRTGFQVSGVDFMYLWSDDAGTTVYGKLI